MKVECKSCGSSLQVPEDAFGKMLRCPQCKHTFKLDVVEVGGRATVPKRATPAHTQTDLSSPMDELASAASSEPTYRPIPSGYRYPTVPPKKPKWLVPVIIAGVAVVGLVIAWQSGVIGSKTSGKSLEQFKKELADISIEAQGEIVTKKALIDKMGEPEKVQVVASDVYIYYNIAGGMVQIISDQLAWEGGRGQKIQKAGVTRPKQPQGDELIEWYRKSGRAMPVYSIQERTTGSLLSEVVVLKDGQSVKRFSAKSSMTTTACKNPRVVHKLKGEYTLDPSKYSSDFVGCFVIEDENGKFIGAVSYFSDTDSERSKAQKKAEEEAAGLRKNYGEAESSFQYAVGDRKKDAQNYIDSEMRAIRSQGESEWFRYIEQWEKDNSIVVKEPIVFIGKINMY